MSSTVQLRHVALADAAVLAAIVVRNRVDLEAVDPPRPDDFYTVDGQQRRIGRILDMCTAGTGRFFVIIEHGEIVGDIGITGIERGWFGSAHVGYMVDQAYRGRGVATSALRLVIGIAFGELELHRLDAGVLTENVASQRVLEKAGFRRIGVAERYLFLAGAWRDNYLYELVGPDTAPADPWT